MNYALHINSLFHCSKLNFFTEFAENGSIFDYIHKKHKQPSLTQSLQWAKEVAEGTICWEVKYIGINSTCFDSTGTVCIRQVISKKYI